MFEGAVQQISRSLAASKAAIIVIHTVGTTDDVRAVREPLKAALNAVLEGAFDVSVRFDGPFEGRYMVRVTTRRLLSKIVRL
jgi:hypothetical protein